jgi:hypothetical protein
MALRGITLEPYAPNLLSVDKPLTTRDIEDKGLYGLPSNTDMGASREALMRDLDRRIVEEGLAREEKEEEAKKLTPKKALKYTADIMGLTTPEEQIKAYGAEKVTEAVKRGVGSSLDGIGLAFTVATPDVDDSDKIKIFENKAAEKKQLQQLYPDGWKALATPEMWAETLSSQLVPMGGATTAGVVTGLTPAAPAAPAVALTTGTALYTMQGFGNTALDTYIQARDEGRSPEESYKIAVDVGMAGGALEGVTGLLPVVGKFGRTMIARLSKGVGDEVTKKSLPKIIKSWDKITDTTGKRLALSTIGEGAQEGFTDALVDVAKDIEGLEVKYNLEKYLQSATVGAGTGLAIGGVQELAFKDKPEQQEKGLEEVAPDVSITPEAEALSEIEPTPEAQAEVSPKTTLDLEKAPDKEPVQQLYKPEQKATPSQKKPADYVIYSDKPLSDKEKLYIASNSDGTVQFATMGEKVPSKAGQNSYFLKYDEKNRQWDYQYLGEQPSAEGLTTEPQKAEQAVSPEKPVATTPKPIQEQAPIETQAPVQEQAKIAEPVQAPTEPVKESPVQDAVQEEPIKPIQKPVEQPTQESVEPVEQAETALETPKKQEAIQEPTKPVVKESLPTETKPVAEEATIEKPTEEADVEQELEQVQEDEESTPEPTEKDLKDTKSTSKWIRIDQKSLEEAAKVNGIDLKEKQMPKKDAVTFKNAVDKGHDRYAILYAKEVNEGKKVLDDEETAGMALAYARAKKDYEDAVQRKNKAEESGNESDYQKYSEAADALYEPYKEIVDALRTSSSKSGKSLRSYQFAANVDDMSIESLSNRIRRIKNADKNKSKANKEKFDRLEKELRDSSEKNAQAEKKIAELEKQLEENLQRKNEAKASEMVSSIRQEAIKIRKQVKVKSLEQRNEEIRNRLVQLGYRANDVIGATAGGFEAAKLISELITNKIRIAVANNEAINLNSLISKVQSFFENAKEHMPSKSDILSVLRMKESAKKAKTIENARSVERKLRRQAKLIEELENATNGIIKRRERNQNAKEKGGSESKIYDEEIQFLESKIKEARKYYFENVKDDKILARLNDKLDMLRDMLDRNVTKFPDTKEGRQDRADVALAREKVDEATNIMNARRSTQELSDEINNFDKTPLPKEKKNESPELKAERQRRDLKRKELNTMRSLQRSIDTLENDVSPSVRVKTSSNTKITSDAIENMRTRLKELREIRKQQDESMTDSQRVFERTREQIDRNVNLLKKKVEALKQILATGNKEKRKAGILNETDEEKQLKQEYRSLMEELKKNERIKNYQDKYEYAEQYGLPKGKERKVDDPDIAKVKKEYRDLISDLKKEEKAMTAPSLEDAYNKRQDEKLERIEDMIEAIKKGTEIARRKRTEDRVDVKAAKARLQEIKSIDATQKSLDSIKKDISDAIKSGDISGLMKYAPKERPVTSKELAMLRKQKREQSVRVQNILRKAQQVNEPLPLKIASTVFNTLSDVWRSLKLGLEAGWNARQGIMYLLNLFHWRKSLRSYGGGWKALLSKKAGDELDSLIRNDVEYEDAKYYKLPFEDVNEEKTSSELQLAPELFKKIPLIGHGLAGLIDMSQRSPAVASNMLRLSLWKEFTKNNPNATEEQKFTMAKQIAITTGRGAMGRLEPSVRDLNKVFLTARFFASLLQNSVAYPLWMKGSDKTTRIEALKAYSYLPTGILLLTTLSIAGLDVEWDEEDSDFLKVRVGDKMIAPLGPFTSIYRQELRIAKRMAGYYPDNRTFGKTVYDEAGQLIKNRLNMGITETVSIGGGRDFFGREVSRTELLLRSLSPINAEAAWDTYQLKGDISDALLTLGLTSAGVPISQAYEKKNKSSGFNFDMSF